MYSETKRKAGPQPSTPPLGPYNSHTVNLENTGAGNPSALQRALRSRSSNTHALSTRTIPAFARFPSVRPRQYTRWNLCMVCNPCMVCGGPHLGPDGPACRMPVPMPNHPHWCTHARPASHYPSEVRSARAACTCPHGMQVGQGARPAPPTTRGMPRGLRSPPPRAARSNTSCGR